MTRSGEVPLSNYKGSSKPVVIQYKHSSLGAPVCRKDVFILLCIERQQISLVTGTKQRDVRAYDQQQASAILPADETHLENAGEVDRLTHEARQGGGSVEENLVVADPDVPSFLGPGLWLVYRRSYFRCRLHGTGINIPQDSCSTQTGSRRIRKERRIGSMWLERS